MQPELQTDRVARLSARLRCMSGGGSRVEPMLIMAAAMIRPTADAASAGGPSAESRAPRADAAGCPAAVPEMQPGFRVHVPVGAALQSMQEVDGRDDGRPGRCARRDSGASAGAASMTAEVRG